MESIDRVLFEVKKNQVKMMRDRGYLFPEDSNDENILEATYEQFLDYLVSGLGELNPDTRKNYTLSQLLNQVYVDPTQSVSQSEGEKADLEQQRREEAKEGEEEDDFIASEEEGDEDEEEQEDEEEPEDEEAELEKETSATGGEKVFVWFPAEFETGKQVGNKELDPLFEEIGDTDVRHLVVITKFPLSDKAKKRIRESPISRFEVFLYHEMTYNPLEHFLVPMHRILPPEERQNFLRQFPDYTKLPYLNSDDRICRHLGAKVGDVVEIDGYNISYEGDVSRSLRMRAVRPKDPGLLLEIERAGQPEEEDED